MAFQTLIQTDKSLIILRQGCPYSHIILEQASKDSSYIKPHR